MTAEAAVAMAVEKGPVLSGYQPVGVHTERFVATKAAEMPVGSPTEGLIARDVSDSEFEAFLGDFDTDTGFSLNADQRHAVQTTLRRPLSLLIGGA